MHFESQLVSVSPSLFYGFKSELLYTTQLAKGFLRSQMNLLCAELACVVALRTELLLPTWLVSDPLSDVRVDVHTSVILDMVCCSALSPHCSCLGGPCEWLLQEAVQV